MSRQQHSAWIFPGQGSQYPGMGRGFLFESDAVARRVFEEAEEISGQPLRELSKHADAASLRNCEVLEPLLAAFAIAYVNVLRRRNERPRAVAGYSAGEVPALYCAGVLTQTDALCIATLRGRILQGIAAHASGSMCAVLGMPAARVEREVAELAREGTIAIAGWNAPDHVTVVGEVQLMQCFATRMAGTGAQLHPVDVAGAWHCSLAQRAAPRIATALGAFQFRAPHSTFFSSVSGQAEHQPERLRQNLAEQICRPVQWQAVIEALHACLGVSHFLEVGAGRSLYGITRRHDQSFLFLSFYQATAA